MLYRHKNGFYIGPTVDYVGERYADFANSYKVDSYTLFGLKSGWSNQNFKVFAEVRNLLERDYIASHSVRAVAAEDDAIIDLVDNLSAEEMEEERRLAYVGITRAMERLHLTHAWSRTLFGQTQYNPPSRFLDEIAEDLVQEVSGRRRASRGGRTYGASGRADRQRRGTYGGGDYARSRSRSNSNEPEGRVFGRGAGPDDQSPDESRIDEGRERIVDAALAAGKRHAATDAAVAFAVGDDVSHATFGDGVVIEIIGDGDKAEATISFADVGEKRLLLSWAPLERR